MATRSGTEAARDGGAATLTRDRPEGIAAPTARHCGEMCESGLARDGEGVLKPGARVSVSDKPNRFVKLTE